MREFLQKYYQHYHQLLAKLFERGFSRGEFNHRTDDAAAITLIGQLEGLGLLWAIIPDLLRLPDQSEAALNLLLRGLMAANN